MTVPSQMYHAFLAGRDMSALAASADREGRGLGEYFQSYSDLYDIVNRSFLTSLAGFAGSLSRPISFFRSTIYDRLPRDLHHTLEEASIRLDISLDELGQVTESLSAATSRLGKSVSGLEGAVNALENDNPHE